MEVKDLITVGMVNEVTFPVEERHITSHIGSGTAPVLATPWLIGFMEATAHRLLMKHLPAGQSSVGIHVDMRHLAPTPPGQSVRVRAEVTAVEGFKVSFAIQAWDAVEQVGECQHQRAVIDVARFQRRVDAKAQGPKEAA
jgi:predicted thioesterase